jgi:protein-disulfide isomerase
VSQQSLVVSLLFIVWAGALPSPHSRVLGQSRPAPDPGALVLRFAKRTLIAPVVRLGSVAEPDASGLVQVVVRLGPKDDDPAKTYYITGDGREVIEGTIARLDADPWESARALLRRATADAPTKGSASAPVVLVEFSDFECPYCSELGREIDEIEAQMPNELRVVFRHAPLQAIHPWAGLAAQAAVCVSEQGEAKFWRFERALFGRQKAIRQDTARAQIRSLASELGADLKTYDGCMSSPSSEIKLGAFLADVRAAEVSSTPTIFINGRRIQGLISADTLRSVVLNEASLVAEAAPPQRK